MPFDPAGDMHVFFAADEFGEAILAEGVAGEIVGIWDRPTGEIELPSGRSIVDINMMRLPVAQVADPIGLGVLTIKRTGERFVIDGEPRLNRDGSIWICELAPA